LGSRNRVVHEMTLSLEIVPFELHSVQVPSQNYRMLAFFGLDYSAQKSVNLSILWSFGGS